MASRSMISDHGWVSSKKTVIERARTAAGLSQRRLAMYARTQQSSVSEYESRRKSPTLEVVERLLDAAGHQLVARPTVYWDYVDDPEIGRYAVPDKLWSVPIPDCFARVETWRYVFPAEAVEDWPEEIRMWDLADEDVRISFYGFALQHGLPQLMQSAVDGALLIQVWLRLDIPNVIRTAWQPLIDAATASHDRPVQDPGEVNAWMAGEVHMSWPLKKAWIRDQNRRRLQSQAGAGARDRG